MSTILDDPKRRTIPRWRRWRDTVQLGDVDASVEVRVPNKPYPIELMRAKFDWETNRSLPFAGDFIGVAFAIGEGHAAKEAAEFVLKAQPAASKAAHDLAHVILREQSSGGKVPMEPPPLVSESERRQRVRKLRTSLREFPRNPLAYMDLALEYVALGQHASAVKPIEIALALAPNSRFVLRSAARFFLHFNDPKQAHRILRKADRVKTDPWLLAAEIAVADAAGRTSSLVKIGHQFIESKKFSPAHISELASALGTLESEGGNARLVKRLFKHALVKPTENVVAQAGWVSRHIGDLELTPDVFNTPRSYEARAWAKVLDGHWDDSLTEAEFWLRDEPFAKRAAVFGSWVACVTPSKLEIAVRFAEHGLITHPDEFLLLNNLAVALAKLDRISEAVRTFEKIDPAIVESQYKPTYLATKGLIQFRLGFPEEGRRLYRMAVHDAREKRSTRAAVWALLHFGIEEFHHDPIRAEKLIKEAIADLPKLPQAQQNIAARLLSSFVNQRVY